MCATKINRGDSGLPPHVTEWRRDRAYWIRLDRNNCLLRIARAVGVVAEGGDAVHVVRVRQGFDRYRGERLHSNEGQRIDVAGRNGYVLLGVGPLQPSSADASSQINGDMTGHEPRCMSRACLAGLHCSSAVGRQIQTAAADDASDSERARRRCSWR